MNDYETLYRALSLRCSQVAEKLREFAAYLRADEIGCSQELDGLG